MQKKKCLSFLIPKYMEYFEAFFRGFLASTNPEIVRCSLDNSNSSSFISSAYLHFLDLCYIFQSNTNLKQKNLHLLSFL